MIRQSTEPHKKVFDLFRYQLVPQKTIQLKLFDRQVTHDELVKNKNKYFADALMGLTKLIKNKDDGLIFKLQNLDQDYFLIKLGPKKGVRIQDENFDEKTISNYPDVEIFINNRADTQGIAISRNYRAFASSFSVAHIIEENFERILQEYLLAIYIQPILKKNEFWAIVKKHENKIIKIRFQLIKPNLANISGTIKEGLRDIMNSTNSHKTQLEIHAAKENVLENLNELNDNLKSLVEYAIAGGGSISLKAKGISVKIQTGHNIVREIEIDLIELTGDMDQILRKLKGLISFE